MSTSLVPFSSRIPTQLDSLFDGLFNQFWVNPDFVWSRNWRPTDIKETDKNYTIEIELPRVKREDVSAEVINGVLTVSVKNDKVSFVRSFDYSDMDSENTEVKLEDGVLILTIPKFPSKTKKLEIK